MWEEEQQTLMEMAVVILLVAELFLEVEGVEEESVVLEGVEEVEEELVVLEGVEEAEEELHFLMWVELVFYPVVCLDQ